MAFGTSMVEWRYLIFREWSAGSFYPSITGMGDLQSPALQTACYTKKSFEYLAHKGCSWGISYILYSIYSILYYQYHCHIGGISEAQFISQMGIRWNITIQVINFVVFSNQTCDFFKYLEYFSILLVYPQQVYVYQYSISFVITKLHYLHYMPSNKFPPPRHGLSTVGR